MTSSAVTLIQSRDNALVKDLRRLAQDTTAYRKQGRVWLEGDHLCRAALERSVRPAMAVFSESYWPQWQHEKALAAIKIIAFWRALGHQRIASGASPSSMRRAMMTRMISLVPSRIWCTRASRSRRSSGYSRM